MHFALSGEPALEIIDKNLPDLMIIDVRMPGMQGPQVLRKLRRFAQPAARGSALAGYLFEQVKVLREGLASAAWVVDRDGCITECSD